MSTRTEETREEKYSRQTNEQFAALGRYVQEFELVLHVIRFLIESVFVKNGLKNRDLIQVIISHHSVAAQVLIDSFSSIMIHLYDAKSDEIVVMNDLRKRFQKEIESRNEYLHGTWFIGWASQTQQDFLEMHGHKMIASAKKGLQLRKLATSVSQLRTRIEALEEIKEALWRLHGCLIGELEVKRNFIKFKGRYVSPDTVRKRGWEHSEQ